MHQTSRAAVFFRALGGILFFALYFFIFSKLVPGSIDDVYNLNANDKCRLRRALASRGGVTAGGAELWTPGLRLGQPAQRGLLGELIRAP